MILHLIVFQLFIVAVVGQFGGDIPSVESVGGFVCRANANNPIAIHPLFGQVNRSICVRRDSGTVPQDLCSCSVQGGIFQTNSNTNSLCTFVIETSYSNGASILGSPGQNWDSFNLTTVTGIARAGYTMSMEVLDGPSGSVVVSEPAFSLPAYIPVVSLGVPSVIVSYEELGVFTGLNGPVSDNNWLTAPTIRVVFSTTSVSQNSQFSILQNTNAQPDPTTTAGPTTAAPTTLAPSGGGDPHFVTVSNKKIDLTHDDSLNGKYLKLYATVDTIFYARLAATVSGMLYMDELVVYQTGGPLTHVTLDTPLNMVDVETPSVGISMTRKLEDNVVHWNFEMNILEHGRAEGFLIQGRNVDRFMSESPDMEFL
jgi:hypothetical protein